VIIRSEFRIPVLAKIFFFSKNSILIVGVTHSYIKWVAESFLGGKADESWS